MIFLQPSKIKLISGNLYIASPSQTRAAARFTRKLRFIDDFNSFSSGKFCSTKVDQGRPRSIQGHRGKIIPVILEESSGQNSRPNGQAGGDNVKTMKKNLLNDL